MLELNTPLRQNYSLRVAECAEGLVITVADQDSVTVGGDYQPLLRVLGAIDGESTGSEIEAVLHDEAGLDPSITREILEFAWESNLVQSAVLAADALPARDALKWDRQIKNFTHLTGVDDQQAVEMQQRLQGSHVVVLGVGGVGGYTALGLAMVGVGRMTLVDHDSIELSNTSRQVLYGESTVGRMKLDVAGDRLREHNASIVLQSFQEQIVDADQLERLLREAEEHLGAIDILVVNADTPRGEIAYIVDEACERTRTPFIFMGPHDFSKATIGPLVVPGETKRYADHFPRHTVDLTNPAVTKINDRYRANIMDPFNGLSAKMGAIEICKFLSGYRVPATVSRVITIDTDDWSIEEFALGD